MEEPKDGRPVITPSHLPLPRMLTCRIRRLAKAAAIAPISITLIGAQRPVRRGQLALRKAVVGLQQLFPQRQHPARLL